MYVTIRPIMKPVVANAGSAPMSETVFFRESAVVVDAARKLARDEGYPLAAVLRGLLRDWVDAHCDARGGEDGGADGQR